MPNFKAISDHTLQLHIQPDRFKMSLDNMLKLRFSTFHGTFVSMG